LGHPDTVNEIQLTVAATHSGAVRRVDGTGSQTSLSVKTIALQGVYFIAGAVRRRAAVGFG